MKRREFLMAGGAAVAAVAARAAFAASERQDRQLLELRTYRFASEAKREAFEQFMAQAAVPAINRAGVKPVGVCKPAEQQGGAAAEAELLYVLLPHDSFESMISLGDRLASDQTFKLAGQPVLNAPKSDPAYLRYDSTLLRAFEGFPRVQVPTRSESRVLELRTYQSHNHERARNKISMFNNGEFEIFQRAGMPGVFFGGALIGSDLPQLTYMVAHENAADVKKNWKAFFADDAWARLSSDKQYKDNVSKVIDRMLRPAGGSQI